MKNFSHAMTVNAFVNNFGNLRFQESTKNPGKVVAFTESNEVIPCSDAVSASILDGTVDMSALIVDPCYKFVDGVQTSEPVWRTDTEGHTIEGDQLLMIRREGSSLLKVTLDATGKLNLQFKAKEEA